MFSLRLLKDEDLAKDTVQDVFMYLLEKRGDVEVRKNIGIFLYVKTRSNIISLIRKQKVKQNYLEAYLNLDVEVYVVPADHLVRERQLQDLIEQEIQALPPKMRAVFEASRKKYLSYEQIASQEGKSTETVRRQISLALGILRGKLGSFLLQLMTFLLWHNR